MINNLDVVYVEKDRIIKQLVTLLTTKKDDEKWISGKYRWKY